MLANILVIRLSSLGDIVLTAPVYRALKRHWPDCRITVLVKPQYAALLEGHPCVDRVMPFRGLLDAIGKIRSERFTHLLDLHANLRSSIIRWLGGAGRTSTYRKAALARRLFVALGWRSPALAKHTLERYLDGLAAWGVRPQEGALELGDSRAAPLAASAGARVVVLQTAFLGDAALTVPLLDALRTAFPAGRLTLVTRPESGAVFRGHADEIWTDDKRGGALGLWRLSRRLAAGHFDLAVVPHRSLRSALAVWLAGIPERIGFSASAGWMFFTRTLPFSWGMHDLERNLSLLIPLLPALRLPENVSVYLKPREDAAASKVGERLSAEGVSASDLLVGVHPGSVWATKRWPLERYAELTRRLSRELGARVLLVGSGGDQKLTAELAERSQVPAIDWAGKTSLEELIELMGRLRLFITNDSGPMHIATARGVPTLGIFGPTTRELGFFPYGPGHRVLEADLACRPCGLHGTARCPHGHFLCMRLISVREVFETAKQMLSAA